MSAVTDESNSIQKKSSCFQRLAICLLLAVITLMAFWPATRLGYTIYDDQDYVTRNQHVQAGLSAANVVWAFTTDETGNWHPMTWLSLMLDTQLFGLGPASHHWVNLILHTASAVLLFLVLCRMTSRINGTVSSTWCSALVAALFAVHPLRVESVAWIAERKDVLCAFFLMLTLWAWTKHALAHSKELPARLRLSGSFYYWLSLVFFALGLMSKAMIVSLPILLLLLDYWPLKRMEDLRFKPPSPRNLYLLFEKLPFCALCVACSIVTYHVQYVCGSVGSLSSLPMDWRIENSLVSYGLYLKKTFWPAGLTVVYPIHDLSDEEVFVSVVVLAGISLIAILQISRRPYLAVGWFWFLIMFAPVIGLVVQIGKVAMADRYSYLPSIGLLLALVWLVAEAVAGSKLWKTTSAAAAIILVAASVVATRHQLGYWINSEAMFRHSVELRTKDNYEAYLFLGNALSEEGKLDEAITNFENSIQIQPNESSHEIEAHFNMACVLAEQKRYAEAKEEFQEVIQNDSKNMKAHLMLGRLWVIEKKYADAQSELTIAQNLAPEDPTIRAALEHLELKNTGQAELTRVQAVLRTNATPDLYVKAAMVETLLERYQDATNHYANALKLKPDSPEILNNLAWLLATCPDDTVRNGAQAVKYAEQAAKLTGYQQTMIMGTLAAAYAEAGRFEDAVATAQKACDSARKTGDLNLLQKNQMLLVKYQNRETYLDKKDPNNFRE